MTGYFYIPMYLGHSITTIIPCYNEGNRIEPVLTAIASSLIIDEVIVVDDGSNKFTQSILKKHPGIKLIRHSKNKGKSMAMKTGLLASTSDIVVFMDADLTNFQPKHLRRLIKTFIEGKFDMILGDRENEELYVRITGFSTAYTGERVFSRQFLLTHLDLFNVSNYLIEASLNQYTFHHGKTGKVLLKGVGQTPKRLKNGPQGFIKGLERDVKMTKSIVNFLGFKEFATQLSVAKNLPYC